MFPSKYVSQVSARICERRPDHRLNSDITRLFLVYQESLATVCSALFGLPVPQICETINSLMCLSIMHLLLRWKVDSNCTENSNFHQTRK